ncbi:MAG: virulence protein RhuM/Fic/DOC family protein [Planctomycetes bacterium]|nr:virulence protein RhuM/Fic/DOC family protein [Planctomycetota bacterium]
MISGSPGGEVVVYETPDGEIRVEVRLDRETVWLSLNQMAELFGRDKSVISRHLRNVFRSGELEREATVAKNATVQKEGGRKIAREIEYFNLDAILSVGYRVNSKRGTLFRIWATRTLSEHLVRGYTFERQRFARNAAELEAALSLIRKAAAGEALSTDQGRGLVDVIARYTRTFLLLQRYDEGLLTEPKGNAGGTLPVVEEARAAVARLKADLLARGDASDLFGREREDGLAALLGNLEQSAFGEPAYPTVESKAAHLLYFVIKNHPFSDGNKRIGSFLFVDFLNRNDRLFRYGEAVINDVGLAALALLVAESEPKEKDVMIRLVMNMLAGAQS